MIKSLWNVWEKETRLKAWSRTNFVLGGLATSAMSNDIFGLVNNLWVTFDPVQQLTIQRSSLGVAIVCGASQWLHSCVSSKEQATRKQEAARFEAFREQSARDLSELQTKCENLESDNQQWAAQVDKIVEGHLIQMATNHLDFGRREGTAERISLYLHEPAGYFVPKGRYSANVEYSKIGRRQFPESEGCIGRAWRDGIFSQTTSPTPSPTRKATRPLRDAMG